MASPTALMGYQFAPQPDTGQRIKARREEIGKSQVDLASDNVSYAQVSRIESGKRSPSLVALIEIAETLKTTALYLATGDYKAECPVCGRGPKSRRAS